MQDNMGSTHPHYALIEYARDMHQYTLELWMELSKKIDAEGSHSVPDTDATTRVRGDPSHATMLMICKVRPRADVYALPPPKIIIIEDVLLL
ncbi:hypothetical protein C8Q76DRAFT_797392 [Earliella scabrosa]|nr:hypothetical protein C8Q76DRAFT_797392 [Earliella scabrosa]